MQLSDSDAELFKTWIIPKLENISDADSDVVADYVLALVRTDQAEVACRASCLENLQDFLLEHTQQFVKEIFDALKTRAYDPRTIIPKPAPFTATSQHPSNFNSTRQTKGSEKRGYHDLDAEWNQVGNGYTEDSGNRPMKQARKQQMQQHSGRDASYDHNLHASMFPAMPPVPPGMPMIDFNNPMATIMAMQEFIGSMLPGMINAGTQGSGQVSPERCRDYDNKGFCTRGASCPYDHGGNQFVVPHTNGVPNTGRSRVANKGRGRGSNYRRGGDRSEFSQRKGERRSETAIVVEQIPEDKCDEQMVRDTFAEFGAIEEVIMHPESKLAIVKYNDHDSAQAAYNSPKAFFENRFVKVYYQRQDEDPSHSRDDNDTEMNLYEAHANAGIEFDLEELEKRQNEAQRKYEESKKEREQTEKRRLEISEQLRDIEQERRRIALVISKRTGIPLAELNVDDETEETKALKEQLAQLQAEAKSLGIDPEVASNSDAPHNRYHRGAYRGRYRGRGRGPYSSTRGGAVKRLDNRPKAISIQFQDGQYNVSEESLRQYLLFSSAETASLAKNPDQEDSAIVSFNERYQAENFLVAVAGGHIPGMSGVELSWHKEGQKTNDSDEVNDQMENVEVHPSPPEEPAPTRDMDTYDLADDDDQWG